MEEEDRILLNAVDLYRIANVLEMEVVEVIEQYCDMVPGEESMLPLLMMKEHLDGSCIFLKKGKCRVQDGKPVVCALFPLGRLMFLDEGTGEYDFHYYVRDVECHAMQDTEEEMQDWLDRYEIEKYDGAMKLYRRIAKACTRLMHEAASDQERQEYFMNAFFMMYAKISRTENLEEQLMQNLAYIQSMKPELFFDVKSMS